MPVSKLHVTMFFKDIYGLGWQESHLFNQDTATGNLNVVQLAVKQMLNERVFILSGEFYTLTDVRLSYDDVFRDSYLLVPGEYPVKSGGKYNGNFDIGAHGKTNTHTSMPVRFAMNNNKRFAITMFGGWTDNYVQTMPPLRLLQGANGYPTSFGDIKRFLDYMVGLTGNTTAGTPGNWGAGVRLISQTDGITAAPKMTVTAVGWGPGAGVAGNLLKLTIPAGLQVNPPIVPGSYVVLSGMKLTWPVKRIRINGAYQVVDWDDTTKVLTVSAPKFFQQPTIGLPGYVQGTSEIFQPYQAYSIRSATHRKRGRPSFEPRGHR